MDAPAPTPLSPFGGWIIQLGSKHPDLPPQELPIAAVSRFMLRLNDLESSHAETHKTYKHYNHLDDLCRHNTKWTHITPEDIAEFDMCETASLMSTYWVGLRKEAFRIALVSNDKSIIPKYERVFRKLIVNYRADTGKHAEYMQLVHGRGVDGSSEPSLSNIRGWENAANMEFGGPDVIVAPLAYCGLIKSLRPGGCVILRLPSIPISNDIAVIDMLMGYFETAHILVTSFDYFYFIGIKMVARTRQRAQMHVVCGPASLHEYSNTTLADVNKLYEAGAESRYKFYESVLSSVRSSSVQPAPPSEAWKAHFRCA